jgi:signal transduction histidine kinase/ActR/RegA family two-component response regulator
MAKIWLLAFISVLIWVSCICAYFNFSLDEDINQNIKEKEVDARRLAADGADSIERNLRFIHGIPNSLEHAIRVNTAVARFGPKVLATSLPKTVAAAKWMADPVLTDLNVYLKIMQSAFAIDQIYVVNAAGDSIASSNWDEPVSSIGTNFADRTWFKDGVAGKNSVQYAIGRTTHIPGLFFSTPVMRNGQFMGAVVAKINMSYLSFLTKQLDIYVADENGIIILAHDDDMLMKAVPNAKINRLSTAEQEAMYLTHKFDELSIINFYQKYTHLKQINHETYPHILAEQSLPDYGLTIYGEIDVPTLSLMESGNNVSKVLVSSLGSLLIIAIAAVTIYFRRIREASYKADASNRAKGEFLANMSHEIRTPMNAVIGLAELALDSMDNKVRQDYLQQILDSSKSLLEILNDILDISKIEAGEMAIANDVFDLDELLHGLQRMFSIRTQEKNLIFTIIRPPSLPGKLIGDQKRLRQVLVNLLGNAIKFTDHGTVQLEIRHVETHDTKLQVYFDVKDSGIGMTKEQLNKLFQSFVQADNSISRRFGGTGLGLSISRQLAHLMGGEIQVQSEPGQGSTFSLQLTLEVASTDRVVESNERQQLLNSEALKAEDVEILRGQRMLLVEDNRVNQLVASQLLKKNGIVVDIANNGQEAIDLLQATQYSVILMDIQMPVLDGLEATKRIRKVERFKLLPIIAMSAGVTLEEQDQCAAAGMTAFLSKPIDSKLLTQKLISILDTQSSRIKV